MKTKPRDKDEIYHAQSKNADEMFCYSCGFIVKRTASFCPRCNVPLGYVRMTSEGPKEKETAILLALFTSFFTWAYLFDKSEIKFYTGLGVSVVSVVSAIVLFDQIGLWYLTLIPLVLVWAFALIDVSLKDTQYYKSFRGS